MKFLIPVDGSENAGRAVAHLIRLAQCRESPQILLLNVREPVDAWEVRRFLNDDEIAQMQKQEGETDLRGARALLDAAGLAYQAEVVEGSVAATIARYAEEHGCDYIVMGTHGRGALVELFLGSVAAKVIHLAQVPIILVK